MSENEDIVRSLTHYAHRTGQSTYQRCPRQWYWGIVWNGIGLTRVRIDVPLARGIFVHRGLEWILQGKGIDPSIKHALTEFDKEVGERGLDVASLEDGNYVYKEQKALIEAMLYGWHVKRYPELIERFDILEVEHEEVWEIGEFVVDGRRVKLVWLGKADALLREKDTNDLYIQSFKTTGEWDTRKDSAAMHDIQGLSELCTVEHRLGEWWHKVRLAFRGEAQAQDTIDAQNFCDRHIPVALRTYLRDLSDMPKIQGIRMEHLLSGPRKEAKRGTGFKVQYSPLIRGYKKDGVTSDLDEYCYKFQWDDEYGTHRLGKGWVGFNAWEQPGGVRAWVDRLAAGQHSQADLGDALDSQFVYPTPYYRQSEDVVDWLQQMIAEELRKFSAVESLRKSTDANQHRQLLNMYFPQFRHSCDYPRQCWAVELCFSPGYADQPDTTGLYTRRDPHHATEKAALIQIEGLE